jgi:hypothetical protein
LATCEPKKSQEKRIFSSARKVDIVSGSGPRGMGELEGQVPRDSFSPSATV